MDASFVGLDVWGGSDDGRRALLGALIRVVDLEKDADEGRRGSNLPLGHDRRSSGF